MEPKYVHDSNNEFLGRVHGCDVYLYRPIEGEYGLLLRQGNEPWDYASVWISTLERQLVLGNECFTEPPEYQEAFKLWKNRTGAKKKPFVYEYYDPFSGPIRTATFQAYSRGGADALAKLKFDGLAKKGRFYIHEIRKDDAS